MDWIREFLQNIGIDAVWAIFIVAISLAVGLAFLIWLALIKVQKHVNKIPLADMQKGSSLALSAICRIKPWLVFSCVFFAVLTKWSLVGENELRYVQWAIMLLVVYQVGLLADGILKPLFTENSKMQRASSIGAIGLFLSRLMLWAILILIVLDNFGVKITALVAGLGVGGIAIALAVKSILEDIFASLTLALDKPFAPGDTIAVGEFRGTVESIGIKTTHVRSVDGEMLIFPNSDLLQSRLRNFGRMRERRVLFVLGITYETGPAKVRDACNIIKEVITKHEKARLDRVHFLNFNASSLDIEVVYWARSAEFGVHAELRQSINFEILERFNAAGIEFAYPTQRTIGDAPTDSPPKGDVKNA